jgi:hypothetical protein
MRVLVSEKRLGLFHRTKFREFSGEAVNLGNSGPLIASLLGNG